MSKIFLLLILITGCTKSSNKKWVCEEIKPKKVKNVLCANATYDWVWTGTSCAKCRIEFEDGSRETRCGPFLKGDVLTTRTCGWKHP